MEPIVGYGFRPTDEELVNHYLNNKILGHARLVDNAINEVNIYSFDPWELPSQSRIDSKDFVWHFFCRVENKKMQSRTTSSGHWKKTGPDIDIRPRRGIRGHKIGQKKVFVFQIGGASTPTKTEWTMHEYHTTFFPPHQRTYVICKVGYKGGDLDTPYANPVNPSHSFISSLSNVGASSSGSEVNQPVHGNSGSYNWQAGGSFGELQSPNHFNVYQNAQQQASYWDEDEMQRFLDSLKEDSWKSVLGDDMEIASYDVMQENRNDYRPKKSLTGVCVDDSSDSDDNQAESRSLPKHINGKARDHPGQLQLQGIPPSEKVSKATERIKRAGNASKEENSGMEKIEMEWKMGQDTFKKTHAVNMEKKRSFIFEEAIGYKSRTTQLINTIIGLVLLVALIHQIISVH